MPGRITQESNTTNVISTKMTDPASSGQPTSEPLAPPTPNGDNQTNPPPGREVVFENGPGPSEQSINKDLSKGLAQLLQQIPHDLPELPHMTDGYHPLSKLFERSAQECFNSLNETIGNAQQPSRSPMVNGNAGRFEDADSSPAQRLHWLRFANSNRERFMKLFVLLQWGRQTRQDIGRLVDVFAWMRRLFDYYDGLEDELGSFKRDLSIHKIPRPDIETALEILSTAQSSRMPDLQYLPRPPATAAQTLQTLRNLNNLLHIRLNVHEDLPPYLRDFSISSGRVTFHVANEFELDLSVYDEDPSSPFFFIDFRFLFSPSSEIPTGQLQAELEHRSNAILASEGLAACYDFLHDFVLGYKLSILRQQALQLLQGPWADALKIERMHRSLILHYWANNHQKKSWIEVGVSRARANETLQFGTEELKQSYLSVKWARAGEAVPDLELPDLDGPELDVEKLLQRVVKLHIDHLLGSVQSQVTEAMGSNALNAPYLTTSPDDASSVCLAVPMYHEKTSHLSIEPISGKFTISPRTLSSSKCEDRLATLKQPEQELLPRLQAWRVYDGAEMIRANASRLGWRIVRSVQLDAATRKENFGDESGSLVLLSRWANTEWFVAALPNSELSFSFWAVQITRGPPTLWGSEEMVVRQSRQIVDHAKELSTQLFEQLYRSSVATISAYFVQQGLTALNISFTPLPQIIRSSSSLAVSSIRLNVEGLFSSSRMPKQLILTHYGPELSFEGGHRMLTPTVLHVLKGAMSIGQHKSSCAALMQASDVSVRGDGSFAVLDRSPVGTPTVVQQLLDRLQHVILLQSCLDDLKRWRFEIDTVALDTLSFTYSEDPEKLQATITWSKKGATTLSLSPARNPHKRVFAALQRLLQPQSVDSTKLSHQAAQRFGGFVHALAESLELVKGFDSIESRGNVSVLTDSIDKYVIAYGMPKCLVQIKYDGQRGDGGSWLFEQTQESPRTNEKLQNALKQVMAGADAGVTKFANRVACESQAVGTWLMKLDEAIRSSAAGEQKQSKELPRKSAAPKGGTNKQSGQKTTTSEGAKAAAQTESSQANNNSNGNKANGVERDNAIVID